MSQAVHDRLMELMESWAPGRVLVIGEPLPQRPETSWQLTQVDPAQFPRELDTLGRFDAALVHLPGTALPAGELEVVLGRLKNLHAPRVAIWIGPDEATATRLLALAFEPDPSCEFLWSHDIERYNRQREWNTAEDWAHPENFDKYRW